ncbi:c-type cytochrome [Novosphingobium naphthalenivorans]|nr:c-type cytochrome [Novosphingobium naphthalenivorans]
MRRTLLGITILTMALSLVSCDPAPGASNEGANAGTFGGDSDHGNELAQAHCASCHGPDGNGASPQIPKLAGQRPDYLYAQLMAFRTGERKQAVMSAIAAPLTDAEIDDLAKYYSSEAREPDVPNDAGLAARGEHVYYSSAAPMSGCASCHDNSIRGGMMGMGGMMGSSSSATAPLLNGQHAAYLLAQLDNFASGQRPSTVMGRIAASLSEGDRRAVADYLSSRR